MSVNKVQLANGETIIDISDSTVTPETLAEGVTAHNASGQKITGKMVPGGGKSVQTDWNQTDETAADFIKNKPFGEFTGDTMSWDIEIGSLDFDSLPGGYFAKVSDDIVTMDDLANGCTISSELLGGTFYIPAEEIIHPADGLIVLPDMVCAFVDEAAIGVDFSGIVFPESGVYVSVDLCSAYLTIPGFTRFFARKKLAAEYLPNACTQNVVLYVAYDASNKAWVYKDEECTEMVTGLEMYGFIRQKRNILVYTAKNEMATVIHAHTKGITYVVNTYFSTDANYSVKMAFTSE